VFADATGRVANVVMLGVLSKVAPFSAIALPLWHGALKAVSPNAALWAANYRAFEEGRTLL
jgi:indolepyruvate ferredoxin oxidoreductase, alpha subunit